LLILIAMVTVLPLQRQLDILELVKFQASCIQSQCMGVCVSTGGN